MLDILSKHVYYCIQKGFASRNIPFSTIQDATGSGSLTELKSYASKAFHIRENDMLLTCQGPDGNMVRLGDDGDLAAAVELHLAFEGLLIHVGQKLPSFVKLVCLASDNTKSK